MRDERWLHVSHAPNDGNLRAGRCQFTGCHASTREMKPFCPNHVAESPYVKTILKTIRSRAKQVKKIAGGGPVPDDAHLFKELEQYIRTKGQCTIEGLAREFHLPSIVILRLVKAMSIVRFGKNIRKSITVEIP